MLPKSVGKTDENRRPCVFIVRIAKTRTRASLERSLLMLESGQRSLQLRALQAAGGTMRGERDHPKV